MWSQQPLTRLLSQGSEIYRFGNPLFVRRLTSIRRCCSTDSPQLTRSVEQPCYDQAQLILCVACLIYSPLHRLTGVSDCAFYFLARFSSFGLACRSVLLWS